MINKTIAKIFYEISIYFYMQDIPFKPQAYEKAATTIETLGEDLEDIYKNGGEEAINAIPGVGASMTEKIVEFIKTGKIKEYEKLKKKMPVDIENLISIEGVGPKMVRDLYLNLKIKNLDDLEKAAKDGKISKLPGFGEKSEKNILQGIEFVKKTRGRFLLGDILPVVDGIIERLKSLKEVKKISPAGSVRRMKETIGDVDILVVVDGSLKSAYAKASADAVADFFVSLPGVVKIWEKGATKSSVRMEAGFDVDLRVVPEENYGSALQYFTGSKEHNIALRKIAISKGLKLNEYGIFRGKTKLSTPSEKDVYQLLGLSYIEPEMREDKGEIEAALSERLPRLIDYNDIKGEFHIQSNWNGGKDSIEDLIKAARELGYEYFGISDHTKFLRIENGLDEKQLLSQRKEIEKINKNFKSQGLRFMLLQGCESNIMADGSIDIDDEVLAKLDYVIAGVHSQLKMPKAKMTERIIKAMQNPNVDIISHPMGRILQKRDEYQIDFEKIIEAAKETGTILEINAFPSRLDLNAENIRKAIKAGVKLMINTDAHEKSQLRFMKFGIAEARRGWAQKKDIVNSWPLEKLLRALKKPV